ncbi:restriction endonuclease subunit S [Yersinia pseudotuberculosis]|uniref:restriction endonuclease subunit S n=1 Tax=Yersinia pseudotuberculosis TaxID=633 RepID=UPI00061CC904|nr:restriction endonuclease subunit S [Yersinia pseudotuberculosis]AXY35667.1 restriction endonuclease subunit S [Yersinia pseudotuberculosis]AYX11330.1 restriction endonuclease subunit S [Yersinia pseudotuberculosis]MBO1565689.1 restriction endonuclease subunit S [Yersinia pseudotuberculosis]MBO1602651.1 restriction endonuclease subunit S [Yersinia pseudotuberculosis]CNI39706.1 type I restriction enzyme%2C S subunit [Yersinia pseudotuberculosis]
MSVNNKVPEIRFKGFSGEWYEVALSSVIDIRSGKDYKHLGKGNIPVYGTGGYMLSVDSALSNDDDAIGIGRKGTIDKPCILRAPFWTVDTLFYAVPFPGFNLDFLFCLFQKIEWKKHDESTGVPSLSKIAINNVSVYATNELEQTAIGNYFQKLDSLINQHQQKHDKLSSIKKAMQEKMFPKQGETMPEIRFKGFSGEWQQREFSDIATRVSTHHQSTCLPCVEYEDIVAGKGRFNKDIHQKKTFKAGLKFEADDVLFGKLRPYLKNWFLADFEGLAIGDFWVLRANNVASTFLFSLIQTNKFELISNLSAGSKMPRSDWGLVSSSCFFVPKNISESYEIGNYFQKLDALINQHQQQIAKLNNIKQACLSKMFV